MARVTQVQLIDDLDGGAAAESVSFAVDGSAYEIDLSAEHAAAFRDVLERYLAAARKVRGGSRGFPAPAAARPGRTGAQRTAASAPDPQRVRAWAQANGIEVSGRGRVPTELVAKFNAAQE